MLAADLESRLSGWAAWCRSHRSRRGRCGSAEKFWRSPQCWNLVTHAPININPHDAWAVECVVVALPGLFRETLVAVYVRRDRIESVRRILRRRYRVNDPLPVLQEARQRVGIALAGGARPRAPVPSYVRIPVVF